MTMLLVVQAINTESKKGLFILNWKRCKGNVTHLPVPEGAYKRARGVF